ncbi:MAG: restriction endonuclease subunit S [Lewinellaceae bacterium]|nr:restriction endonuclease subunit S [Lewinellaceae bacterium]
MAKTLIKAGAHKEKHPSNSENTWGVLKTTAIQKNEFWEHENKELPKDNDPREHLEVKAGDILITCAGPRNRCGVACTVIRTRKRLLISGKMYRFRVNQKLMFTKFMTFFLQTQESWNAIDKMKTGGSDSGLNLTHSRFRKLVVKLAPLPEQRAIVAKIEQLFSALDHGIANLKAAKAKLDIYRQAVLKKAFEGGFFFVPTNEWQNVELGKVAKVKGGKRLPKGHTYSDMPTEYPYLRVTDFENMSINTSDLKFLKKETQESIKRYTISKDDVFISIAGSIGRVGTIPNSLDGANLTENAAKITDIQGLNNKYLAWFLSSKIAQDQIQENTKATTQPKLALFRIEKILVNYPSRIEDQIGIVQEIESRLSICDNILSNIDEGLEKAEALRQSILKKAFEGRLLSAGELAACRKEADWAPAGELLARIRAAPPP